MIVEQVYALRDGELGWHEVITDSEYALEGLGCIDCDEPADRITDAGRNRDGDNVLWAHCSGCAAETFAENAAAEQQARYDCEV